MENGGQLETRLWSAADLLRANSNLNSTEYMMPVLGLIFLRHAHSRYLAVKAEIEPTLPKRGGVPLPLTKEHFAQKTALYLQPHAQFEYLLNLPGDQNLGQAINDAMIAIEDDYESKLRGVLPKDYTRLDDDLLRQLLKIFNDEALRKPGEDIFGRINEYFLLKFAMARAQDEGEFFTPPSLTGLITRVIEPDHGKLWDPAFGSGGMFVQAGHFIEDEGKSPQSAIAFYGHEKSTSNLRIGLMNMAIHNLEGQLIEANTYYEDRHSMVGQADFVMANPPFNVDGVDEKVKDQKTRLPFGLPGVNKDKKVGNANYLWISYFYSALNDHGRAGFVMSSQASSAGHDEKTVRRKIIETGAVDVMIAIRPNFFYTRTVPCELWFFDRGKPAERKDKVLMLDARNIYRKVTRVIYDFSPEQLKNLAAIVWLYRGQTERFTGLVRVYLATALREAADGVVATASFQKTLADLDEAVAPFFAANATNGPGEALLPVQTELAEAQAALAGQSAAYASAVSAAENRWPAGFPAENAAQHAAVAELAPLAKAARDLARQIEHVTKLYEHLLDRCLKEFGARKADAWDTAAISKLRRELDATRHETAEQLRKATYFHRQAEWLQERFPDAALCDVEGLVKLVDVKDIEAQDWSLTPGRHVGVAPPEIDDEFDFEQAISDIHMELAGLNEEAAELAALIQANFEELA